MRFLGWIFVLLLLPLVVAMAGLVALIVRGFGLDVVTQPWNPYLPLLFWLVVLLATWSVVDGDHAIGSDLVLLRGELFDPRVILSAFPASTFDCCQLLGSVGTYNAHGRVHLAESTGDPIAQAIWRRNDRALGTQRSLQGGNDQFKAAPERRAATSHQQLGSGLTRL